jgi:hypothetical protein
MTKKKAETDAQDTIVVKTAPSFWQAMIDLIKGSKVLQVGLMVIFFAIAIAIVEADSVSIFGIKIKSSSNSPDLAVESKALVDSSAVPTSVDTVYKAP